MGDLLRFESVTQSFQGRIVLENFSFSLQKGEVIAILGPSGCGKTTILNIAAGLLKQTSGHVHVETEEFGYVFQEPRLLPWKKVIDNVLFVMSKEEKQAMVEKARAALTKVGLEHACDLYPKQLSGGMKQRVSIARALVSNPKIILMDEPFSALDVSLKREIQADVVRLLNERDIGVIYVTHDPEEAARMADRVLIFSHGQSGKTKEIALNVPRNHRSETEILQIRNQLHPFLLGG